MTKYNQMVCLVGESPVPVYLGIRQFAEPNAEVYLLHSAETKPVAERIADTLPTIRCRAVLLPDPYNPIAVAQSIGALRQAFSIKHDAALNYTGGTKVMAAFAVLSWGKEFGGWDNIFYLHEDAGRFRMGNEDDPPITTRLTIDALCSLHGVTKLYGKPSLRLSDEEWLSIFNGWDRIKFPARVGFDNLYEWMPIYQKFAELLSENNKMHWLQAVHPENLPTNKKEFRRSDLSRKLDFAHGTWLESLVKRLVLAINRTGEIAFESVPAQGELLISQSNLLSGQYFQVNDQQFESDVICVVESRLCYLSAGVNQGNDKDQKVLKGKMFEANYRAKQLGGGLARSCVVCLACPDPLDKERYDVIKECRASLGNDPHNTIFGREDIEKWMTGDGQSLLRFLTQ